MSDRALHELTVFLYKSTTTGRWTLAFRSVGGSTALTLHFGDRGRPLTQHEVEELLTHLGDTCRQWLYIYGVQERLEIGERP